MNRQLITYNSLLPVQTNPATSLSGGCDTIFSANPYKTTLQGGSLTVGGGTLVVDRLLYNLY